MTWFLGQERLLVLINDQIIKNWSRKSFLHRNNSTPLHSYNIKLNTFNICRWCKNRYSFHANKPHT